MKLNNLDFNKLKCFQAVATQGGLGAGAKSLSLTTSAVQQSVKKLEKELGVPLFNRTGKSYLLTEAGQELLSTYEEFTKNLEIFGQNFSEDDDVLKGWIRIGLPLNFSKRIFAPIAKRFMELHPSVRFSIHISETNQSVRKVLGFEVDFAITDEDLPSDSHKKLACQQIHMEPLVMICSHHFYEQNKNMILNPMKRVELLHFSYSKEQTILKNWYAAHAQLKNIKIKNFNLVDNVETLLSLVELDLGLAVVPMSLVAGSANSEKFFTVSDSKNEVFNHLFLVQNLDSIPSVTVKSFLKFFNEELLS